MFPDTYLNLIHKDLESDVNALTESYIKATILRSKENILTFYLNILSL